MGSLLVVLFWIWCGASLVIVMTRPIFRRLKAQPISDIAASPLIDSTTATAPGQPITEHPTAERQAAEHPITEHTTAEHPITEHTTTEHQTAGRPITEHPITEHQTAGHPITETSTTGQPATATRVPGTGLQAVPDLRAIPQRSRSVADVLSGIRMPCDLAPLIGMHDMIDPTHVVFAAEGHDAEDVGSQVGDELERIGCDLKPIDPTTLLAERGSDAVEVRIHVDAAAVMDGAERRFPTAPAGSVVVEFSTC